MGLMILCKINNKGTVVVAPFIFSHLDDTLARKRLGLMTIGTNWIQMIQDMPNGGFGWTGNLVKFPLALIFR